MCMYCSTVVVCPPTAYENLGKILDCVFAAKFKVANLKMFRLPRRMAEDIFQNERWGCVACRVLRHEIFHSCS